MADSTLYLYLRPVSKVWRTAHTKNAGHLSSMRTLRRNLSETATRQSTNFARKVHGNSLTPKGEAKMKMQMMIAHRTRLESARHPVARMRMDTTVPTHMKGGATMMAVHLPTSGHAFLLQGVPIQLGGWGTASPTPTNVNLASPKPTY